MRSTTCLHGLSVGDCLLRIAAAVDISDFNDAWMQPSDLITPPSSPGIMPVLMKSLT